NAAPSQALPIITNAAPGQIQLVKWGLVPNWSRDPATGPKPINARAETLAGRGVGDDGQRLRRRGIKSRRGQAGRASRFLGRKVLGQGRRGGYNSITATHNNRRFRQIALISLILASANGELIYDFWTGMGMKKRSAFPKFPGKTDRLCYRLNQRNQRNPSKSAIFICTAARSIPWPCGRFRRRAPRPSCRLLPL
ncbi:MAG: hypothetical protein EOO62_20310, partial [Hymenobacter sp.]